MPRGGRRKNAGRKPLPAEVHLLRGTWRPARHGKRPPTVGALALPPQPVGSWMPQPADLTKLGAAGRALIAALLTHYDFGPVEGCVLLEAGHAADALATVRAAAQPDQVTSRLEMQWSRHFAALLAQLHVEKG